MKYAAYDMHEMSVFSVPHLQPWALATRIRHFVCSANRRRSIECEKADLTACTHHLYFPTLLLHVLADVAHQCTPATSDQPRVGGRMHIWVYEICPGTHKYAFWSLVAEAQHEETCILPLPCQSPCLTFLHVLVNIDLPCCTLSLSRHPDPCCSATHPSAHATHSPTLSTLNLPPIQTHQLPLLYSSLSLALNLACLPPVWHRCCHLSPPSTLHCRITLHLCCVLCYTCMLCDVTLSHHRLRLGRHQWTLRLQLPRPTARR